MEKTAAMMKKANNNQTIEREQALRQYLKLENQKEQITLLISQLQNLDISRKNFFAGNISTSDQEVDYIKPLNSAVRRELNQAMMDQELLERDITSLKAKLKSLDSKLRGH